MQWDLNLYKKLDKKFFERPAVKVAKSLIGKYIIHHICNDIILIAKIVEDEAYGTNDPACHAWSNYCRLKKGESIKGRSAVLFDEPGIAYVYLNYGIYWLFNVVVDKKGIPGAVLIRAVEPLLGINYMQKLRPAAKNLIELTNGPGKLTLALNIDQRYHKKSLVSPNSSLYFAKYINSDTPPIIVSSSRIGISKGKHLQWRFFEKHNNFVSHYPSPRS